MNSEQILSDINNNIKDLTQIIKQSSIIKPIYSVPFNSGSTTIQNATTQPIDDSLYPVQQNIFALNDNKPIDKMQIINDGSGNIFFKQSRRGGMAFSSQEERLNVGDKRDLFNVYGIVMRTDVPLTRYRLVEGELQVGSFAGSYKASVEVRPTLQPNESAKVFSITVDNSPALVPIVPPLAATYLGPSFHAPIAAGVTEQLVDIETFADMPYIVPEGYVLEAFSLLSNFTRDWTLRAYYELLPGTSIYNHAFILPVSGRGILQWLLNINAISTAVIDPNGAPAGGRGILFTVTNDDGANAMVGELDIIMILRNISQ